MLRQEAIIKSAHGLHARPSCAISTIAKDLKNTKVTIENTVTGDSADAKSILSILMLSMPTKTSVTVTAEGEEEQRAILEICKVITDYEAD